MLVRSIYISTVISMLIVSCKTITVSDDNSIYADIPSDIGLIPIPAGN